MLHRGRSIGNGDDIGEERGSRTTFLNNRWQIFRLKSHSGIKQLGKVEASVILFR
jgi:hypothetical protein